MPTQMPPLLPPSAPYQQSGNSSSPRSSPGLSQAYGHAPFASQAFASSPANPSQHEQSNYYSPGTSSPSWQTQPAYVVHPQSSTGQYQCNGAPTTTKGSSSRMHHAMGFGNMAASEPTPFQMPSFQTTPTSFPQQWVSNTSPTPQWASSGPSPHWPSCAMSVGVSSPSSGGSRQAHAQLSALVPPSSGLYSPRGGMLPTEGRGFSMESAASQMAFPDLGSRAGAAGTVPGQYPSASMVITPKTDGAGAVLCDPLHVLLEGSSDQSVLRDGEGSSQTAEASVTIPEWEPPTWMENFPHVYNEEGAPLDINNGRLFQQPKRNFPVPPQPIATRAEQPQQSGAASGGGSTAPSGTPAKEEAASVKTRLRWTPELHEKFVDAVAQLGGPERATPKAVLRVMGVQGITIYHVKSHLQKYRLIPEDSSEDVRNDRRRNDGSLSGIDINSSLQMTQALQMQMEVQKRLHEQLEIQRELQLRIEAQGQSLKMMLEAQAKAGAFVLRPDHPGVEQSESGNSQDLPSQSSQAPESASVNASESSPVKEPSTKRARVEVPNLVIVPQGPFRAELEKQGSPEVGILHVDSAPARDSCQSPQADLPTRLGKGCTGQVEGASAVGSITEGGGSTPLRHAASQGCIPRMRSLDPLEDLEGTRQ